MTKKVLRLTTSPSMAVSAIAPIACTESAKSKFMTAGFLIKALILFNVPVNNFDCRQDKRAFLFYYCVVKVVRALLPGATTSNEFLMRAQTKTRSVAS